MFGRQLRGEEWRMLKWKELEKRSSETFAWGTNNVFADANEGSGEK